MMFWKKKEKEKLSRDEMKQLIAKGSQLCNDAIYNLVIKKIPESQWDELPFLIGNISINLLVSLSRELERGDEKKAGIIFLEEHTENMREVIRRFSEGKL